MREWESSRILNWLFFHGQLHRSASAGLFGVAWSPHWKKISLGAGAGVNEQLLGDQSRGGVSGVSLGRQQDAREEWLEGPGVRRQHTKGSCSARGIAKQQRAVRPQGLVGRGYGCLSRNLSGQRTQEQRASHAHYSMPWCCVKPRNPGTSSRTVTSGRSHGSRVLFCVLPL